MSNFIKHIKNFFSDDNFRGNYKKHIFKKRSRHDMNFELNDNFIGKEPKHITRFEDDDNFRGEI